MVSQTWILTSGGGQGVRAWCGRGAYLGAFLRRLRAHHVVSEELLQQLHLGHAEVEVQAAGDVHLQGVATHHHLLETGQREGGGWASGRKDIHWHISPVCDLKPQLLLASILSVQLFSLCALSRSIQLSCSLFPFSLCPLQGPTHSQQFKPQPGGYI